MTARRPGLDSPVSPEEALRGPDPIPNLLERLQSKSGRIKHGAGKILRDLADRRPELLTPHVETFIGLLDHSNKLLQWEAIFVLSRWARVDAQDRFAALFARYFAPIRGPVMITAANVIKGGAEIAIARPEWADRVAREIVKVSGARYRTAECRRIAIGQAIVALDRIFDLLRDKKLILRFVSGQLGSTRPATRAKAARFLKRRHP